MAKRPLRTDSDDIAEFGDIQFADPGGNSSLRAVSKGNPRNCSCPNCGAKNVLTRRDKALGYQCNSCADAAERGGY